MLLATQTTNLLLLVMLMVIACFETGCTTTLFGWASKKRAFFNPPTVLSSSPRHPIELFNCELMKMSQRWLVHGGEPSFLIQGQLFSRPNSEWERCVVFARERYTYSWWYLARGLSQLSTESSWTGVTAEFYADAAFYGRVFGGAVPQERGERTFAFWSFGNEKERGLDTWKGRVGIICVLINIGGFFKGPLVITRNSNTEFRPLN